MLIGKYDQLAIEYSSYKSILSEQNRNLKFDLLQMTKERELLKEKLTELQTITEKFDEFILNNE